MTQGAQPALTRGRYGKRGIEFVTWTSPQEARVVAVEITIAGPGVDPSFASGDNGGIVTSDALRAHVLRAFGEHSRSSLPVATAGAARALCALGLDLGHVEVAASARHWTSPTSGMTPSGWAESAAIRMRRGAAWTTEALTHGFTGLPVLVSGGSSFTGFRPDPLSDQPEAHDRPLHGTLETGWPLADAASAPAIAAVVASARRAMGVTASNSIQQLLTLVGAALVRKHRLGQATLGFTSSPLARRDGGVHEISTRAFGFTEATVSAL